VSSTTTTPLGRQRSNTMSGAIPTHTTPQSFEILKRMATKHSATSGTKVSTRKSSAAPPVVLVTAAAAAQPAEDSPSKKVCTRNSQKYAKLIVISRCCAAQRAPRRRADHAATRQEKAAAQRQRPLVDASASTGAVDSARDCCAVVRGPTALQTLGEFFFFFFFLNFEFFFFFLTAIFRSVAEHAVQDGRCIETWP
jgi:hypothetical protein